MKNLNKGLGMWNDTLHTTFTSEHGLICSEGKSSIYDIRPIAQCFIVRCVLIVFAALKA